MYLVRITLVYYYNTFQPNKFLKIRKHIGRLQGDLAKTICNGLDRDINTLQSFKESEKVAEY